MKMNNLVKGKKIILSTNKFDKYTNIDNDKKFHKKIASYYDKLPNDINKLKNIIFYGAKGVGKYTQVLSVIKKYSPTKLKYYKRISIPYQKGIYCIKISDIHYEIDLSILGCHSKTLWNSIFENINDIISTKNIQKGILVCKNFHKIHPELLSIFYSYMQTKIINSNKIIFFIITENISFIPSNIVNICKIFHYERPSRNMYNNKLGIKIPKSYDISKITNINNLKHSITQLMIPHHKICDKLITIIIKYLKKLENNPKSISNINNILSDESILANKNNDDDNDDEHDFMKIRELLYDILTYHINVEDSLYYIIKKLISEKYIDESIMPSIMINVYNFLQYYNNNYRPIYHLESFIFNLIVVISKKK